MCGTIHCMKHTLVLPNHMNNGFQQMWAEIKNVWNHPLLETYLGFTLSHEQWISANVCRDLKCVEPSIAGNIP